MSNLPKLVHPEGHRRSKENIHGSAGLFHINKGQLPDRHWVYNLHGRVVRWKLLLTQMNIKAHLNSATTNLDESKGELFGRLRSMWQKLNKEFHKKNIRATVKHGSGSVMLWGCFCQVYQKHSAKCMVTQCSSNLSSFFEVSYSISYTEGSMSLTITVKRMRSTQGRTFRGVG